MFSLIKKVILCIMLAPLTWGYCILLKNQECKVSKVIIETITIKTYWRPVFTFKLILEFIIFNFILQSICFIFPIIIIYFFFLQK